MSKHTLSFSLEPADNAKLALVCGSFDSNLKMLADALVVTIRRRGELFTISGDGNAPHAARSTLTNLYQNIEGSELDPLEIQLAISSERSNTTPPKKLTKSAEKKQISTPMKIAGVEVKNRNQIAFARSLLSTPVTFGEGPAGTGKTFLAVAGAVEMLNQGSVRRIVLIRPAVEAGENLGFLPGDLTQKVHPYLLPLEDALREICGQAKAEKMIEHGDVELAPLAYMRGRTLKDCFVILDEAQNTTVSQMKMLLTRLGTSSCCAVTGDCSQVDLAHGETSGFTDVLRRVENVVGCRIIKFNERDIVRHPVIESILRTYAEKK